MTESTYRVGQYLLLLAGLILAGWALYQVGKANENSNVMTSVHNCLEQRPIWQSDKLDDCIFSAYVDRAHETQTATTARDHQP